MSDHADASARLAAKVYRNSVSKLYWNQCLGALWLECLQKTVLVLEVHGLDHGSDLRIDSQKLLVFEGGNLWDVVVTSLTINMIRHQSKSIETHRSSSWSLMEIPRTGPARIRFIKWVMKPAIWLRRRLVGMMAISKWRIWEMKNLSKVYLR